MIHLKKLILCFITCLPQVLICMEGSDKTMLSLPQDAIRHIADYCSPLDRCHIGRTCKALRGQLEDTRAQDIIGAREDVNENRKELSRGLSLHMYYTEQRLVKLCRPMRDKGAILGGVASAIAGGLLAFLCIPLKTKLPILAPIIALAPIAGYALSFPLQLLPLYFEVRRFKNENKALAENCYYHSKHEAFHDLKSGWGELGFWPKANRYRKENEQEIPFIARKCMNVYYDLGYVNWKFRCWAIKRFVKKMLFSELPER